MRQKQLHWIWSSDFKSLLFYPLSWILPVTEEWPGLVTGHGEWVQKTKDKVNLRVITTGQPKVSQPYTYKEGWVRQPISSSALLDSNVQTVAHFLLDVIEAVLFVTLTDTKMCHHLWCCLWTYLVCHLAELYICGQVNDNQNHNAKNYYSGLWWFPSMPCKHENLPESDLWTHVKNNVPGTVVCASNANPGEGRDRRIPWACWAARLAYLVTSNRTHSLIKDCISKEKMNRQHWRNGKVVLWKIYIHEPPPKIYCTAHAAWTTALGEDAL